MQRSRELNRSTIVKNVFWFMSSLLLAAFIWVIAITEDAQERSFASIPIQIETDEGLLIVDQPTRTARVNVRAPQDVLGLLTNEDIVVYADLVGLGAGTHTVELDTVVSRNLAFADTQPRQITVTLEELLEKQVSVTYEVSQVPPLNFENSAPTFSESQIMVSGPASDVERVVSVQATLDLSDERDTLERIERLIPVDVDGNEVDDVDLSPQTVVATVEIRRKDNVEEIPVSPVIDFSTLEDGYVISSILYDPPTVFIFGTTGELENIPGTLDTTQIDLTGRTDDFEVEVPIVLPDSMQSLRIDGEQTIRVSLVIDAQTTNVQIDSVPVIPISLSEEFDVTLSPNIVSVLVTGPQPVLAGLEVGDVNASVDLADLTPGVYDVEVVAIVSEADVQSVSIIPPLIQVTISEAAEATESPQP